MLQEYQYGYYPDRNQETVQATRSGNNLNIEVKAGGKRATIRASVMLSGGKRDKPAPLVIYIGCRRSLI